VRRGLPPAALFAAALAGAAPPACAPGGGTAGGSGASGAAFDLAADPARLFENEAARASHALEDARRIAETVVDRAAAGREEAEAARDRARRALLEGSQVLEEAARRGGQAAEIWARLIQDRMMRLEESMRALGRSGRGNASS
jgi:hypothetical protein